MYENIEIKNEKQLYAIGQWVAWVFFVVVLGIASLPIDLKLSIFGGVILVSSIYQRWSIQQHHFLNETKLWTKLNFISNEIRNRDAGLKSAWEQFQIELEQEANQPRSFLDDRLYDQRWVVSTAVGFKLASLGAGVLAILFLSSEYGTAVLAALEGMWDGILSILGRISDIYF